ncbi:MAG: CoA transferase [Alphaproteobacteria bacterium GM202ARS2]|nr:CoA transferase [Alphaproteobacteria bacterium GM202ARS2]
MKLSDKKSGAPLAGMRVVDLTRVLAGPSCTQILGDLGADVIKIERPGVGDDARSMGPPYLDSDNPHSLDSGYFLSVNRNKRSLTLNLTQKEGQDIARALIGMSDIVVESFRRGMLARWGLDYASVSRGRKDLIYCSLTGFGQTGPYAARGGYDFLVQALGGLMSVTGEAQGPPMKAVGGLVDIVTGLYASVALLAAVHHRNEKGEGQYIDMALLDSQVAYLGYVAQNYFLSGKEPGRWGNSHPNIVPYQLFEAADAPIILAIGNDAQFRRFCVFAGVEGLAQDERFVSNSQRVRHREALTAILAGLIDKHRARYWLDGLTGVDVPCAPVNTVQQVFADEHVRARGMTVEMAHVLAEEERVRLVASPMKFEKTKVSYRYAPPRCGEHSVEILRELLDMGEEEIEGLIERGITSA